MSNTKSKTIHDRTSRSGRSAPEKAYLGETSPERRAHAERTLARYPALDHEELAELLQWYRREASSMDVALLACNESIGERYRAFRNDHVERLGTKAKAVTALIAVAIAGLVASVGLWELAI